MVIAENPFIQEARAAISSQEALRIQQGQADAICAETRLVTEDLLDQYGSIERNIGTRFATGLLCAIPIFGQLYAPVQELQIRRTSGVHFWEVEDKRVWSTTVGNGQPVNIKFSADHIVPSRAYEIKVRIEGLKQRLVLYKNQGAYDAFVASNRRLVGLEDAQNWHQLITGLREQQ